VIGNFLKTVTGDHIQSISGMDATFLYVETPTSPMHVGAVAVIEGGLSFADFRATIEQRLHLIPSLRRRLMEVPLSIDYPYWVDDPHFDLDLHLNHVALPKPGGWKELRHLAASIFSEPLDKSRPLWSFTFLEGLDSIPQVPEGSVAIVSKIHHVAIDGMAGAGILSLLFDLSPKPFKQPKPKNFKPKPLPNELAMVARSTLSFAKAPLKFPKLIKETLSATLKSGFLTRAQLTDLPTAPFTAPPSPLNGIISARKKWNTAILELDRVKALKNIMDTTLNDVILAICAGALRRYLLEKEKLPRKPLVAMVPISTRTDDDDDHGNQLSSMLVQLATNIEDPIERLEVIHENTVRGKTYQGALGAKTLANMAEAVPFGIANQAARLYTRFHGSELHNPVFNVTITNVPGPPIPLYLAGHKLLAIMGMAPIIDGMGLIITVFSYNGLLTISPTSDANSMPDIDRFSRYLREEANELERLILAKQAGDQAEAERLAAHPAVSDVFFEHLRTYLRENAEAIPAEAGIFQFDITNVTDDPHWKLDLNKSPGQLRKSRAAQPDVVFTISDDHLMRIASGELDVPTAVVQGRLQIEGDMEKAMALGQVLMKMPPLKV
jgi:WS/DGAT/MGAT family acyltransferase